MEVRPLSEVTKSGDGFRWVPAVFNRFGVLGRIFGLDERTAWELERRRDDGGGARGATILEWTEEDVAMKQFAQEQPRRC
jgi:hypothetical protein